MTIVRNKPLFVNHLIDDLFTHLNTEFNTVSNVAVNVTESNENFIIDVNAPGRKKEDFKISAENGLLSISYDTKTEEADKKIKTLKREFAIKSFKRNFNLEDNINIDGIHAKYEAGILSIVLPKKQNVIVQTKSITIN